MIPLEDPTTLSMLFHLNSEPWLNDEAYRSGAAAQEFKRPAGILAEVALPEAPASPLTELFYRRRSCRAFTEKPMPLEALTAMLAASYGVVDTQPFAGQSRFLRRAVPSAGGLFPLEIYAFLRRVEGLEDGLYHYDVLGHSLQLLKRGDLFPSLAPVFYTYPFIRNANLVIALAAVFARTQNKYGPRGYRYILIEAGHCGQNICLRAAELGLATLCMGGFVDSPLNLMLGLEPAREGVVYTIAAGYAE
jgi:SagB-type dehydrogenase family enzyme